MAHPMLQTCVATISKTLWTLGQLGEFYFPYVSCSVTKSPSIFIALAGKSNMVLN